MSPREVQSSAQVDRRRRTNEGHYRGEKSDENKFDERQSEGKKRDPKYCKTMRRRKELDRKKTVSSEEASVQVRRTKRSAKIHRAVLMRMEDYTDCLEKASNLLRSAVGGSFLREWW